MLSAAKQLAAARDRPFAEFILSEANGLMVTGCDCSNGQVLFFKLNLAFFRAQPTTFYDKDIAWFIKA